MNEISESLLRKAERSIAAAETLATTQPEFAASRAYYAMFYVAEALLAARDLHFNKHSAVHSAFGEHFAKPGLLDVKYHRWLLDARLMLGSRPITRSRSTSTQTMRAA